MKPSHISLILIPLLTACASTPHEPATSLSITPVAQASNAKVIKIASNHNLTSDRGTGFGVYSETADKTWVTWAGEKMHAYVREYDHSNNSWSDSTIIGEIPDDYFFQYSWSEQQQDHHNYPKMTQLDNGKLLVINTAHNSRLYKSISPAANSIQGWNQTHYQEINNGDEAIHATYPFVNKSSNGDVYVFYRYTTGDPTDYRPLEMIKSSDHGLTFSAPIRVIDTNDALPANMNEVYNDGFRHEPAHGDIAERFLVGWTMAGGGPNNKHNVYHKNVYFAYFYPGTDTWTDVAGNDFGPAIDEHEIVNCLVFDSGEIDSDNKRAIGYYFAASYSDNGNPILLYNRQQGKKRSFISARWTGSEWALVEIAQGTSLMDIKKVGDDDFIAYKKLGSKIMSYKTVDGGITWLLDNEIKTNIKNLNKVGLIENYHPDIKFLGLGADWKERDTSGKYGVYIIKE